jgi:hypothetical protein
MIAVRFAGSAGRRLLLAIGDEGAMGQVQQDVERFGGMVHVRRIAALGALGVSALLTYLLLTALPSQKTPSKLLIADVDFSVAPQPSPGFLISESEPSLQDRPVYPYSVIPGGVEDPDELKTAIANDPVVAAHYAVFHPENAQVVRLDHDVAAYVSYRLGNRVFWTSKKLRLATGERLISDGEHLARTRCGNQVSETPVGPVSPIEPTPEALESPEEPKLLAIAAPPFEMPIDQPPATEIHPPGHSRFIPPLIPIWWGGTPNTPGVPAGPPPPPPPPPPPNVPEPGTLLMLSAGLTALWAAGKKWKK